VLLSNLRELLGREAFRQPDQYRPQPSMNQRDLAIDEPANENVLGFADRGENGEDPATLPMRPPAALDRFTHDRFCEPGSISLRRSQHDAVFPHECKRLPRARDHAFTEAARSIQR